MMHRYALTIIASTLLVAIVAGAIFLPSARGQNLSEIKIDRKKLAWADKLDDEAQSLYYDGKYAEAAAKSDDAWKLAEEAYGGKPGATAGYFMQRAANLHMILGHMDVAEKLIHDSRDKHWVPLRKLIKGLGADEKQLDAGAVEMIVDCGVYLANIMLEKGRFAEAERELDVALKVRQEIPPDAKDIEGRRQIAMILVERGIVHHRLGDIVKARGEMEEAIRMLADATGGKDTHETLLAKLQYAHLLHEQLEYKAAKEILLESREKYSVVFPKRTHPNGHPYIVKVLALLGLEYAVLGENPRAEEVLIEAEKAQKILSANPWDNTLADIVNKRGLLAMAQGQFEEAEGHFAASLKIRDHLHNGEPHPDLADARHNMGALLVFRKRFEEAIPNIDEAIRLRKGMYPPERYPLGHPFLAKSIFLRALAAAGTGEREGAKAYSTSALEMFQRQAELFAAQSSEAEALNFISELAVFRNGYLSAYADAGEAPDYGLLWSGKSLVYRVLMDRRRALSADAKADPEVKTLVAKWRDVRGRLAGRMLSPASLADPEHSKVLADLTKQKEELERLLSATPGRAILPPSPALKDLIEKLPAGAAFVDIFRYDRLAPANPFNSSVPFYGAFVVRHGQPPRFVDLGPAMPIEKALTKWNGEILARLREDGIGDVHRLVWKPIAPHLPDAKDATLYIAPDGELAQLPWAALPVRGEGTVLLEDYRLALVPNGTFLSERLGETARRFASAPKPKPGDGTFLLVANAAYSERPILTITIDSVHPAPAVKAGGGAGRLEDLSGTAIEADWITPLASRLPGSPRVVDRRRAEASVAQVLRDLPAARIAHLALHGMFASIGNESKGRLFRPDDLALAPNGMRLGAAARNPLTHVALALAGANLGSDPGVGVCLLSGELFAIQDLGRLRLCTLPSCHTGKGEEVGGEGVYGLPRALHQAGVDDVVVALWGVSDQHSPALMLVFYHHLASGKSPIDALREAQLFLLGNPDADQLLAEHHAPRDVSGLIADRSRGGSDPDFAAKPSAPRLIERPAAGKRRPGRTKDWAVFVLSGIGE